MKSAHLVLKDNGEAFLYSNSLTKVNLWIVSEPYLRLSWRQLNSKGKLKLINETLENSKVDIEKPSSFKDVGMGLLKAYGFTKWSQLYKKTKLCYIDIKNDNYIFTPSVYNSSNGGHEGIKDGIETVRMDESSEQIIMVLERAIEKSL
jgi:hypothetical protein